MTPHARVLLAATLVCALAPAAAQPQKSERQRSASIAVPAPSPEPAPPSTLLSTVTFADIGLVAGFRFSNLGGRREIFLPLPQGAALTASELLLVLDDMSAHEARRSLEILVNDRSAAR